MKTLIFTNQKGGVGKTTTTLSTGAALARMGYKVLLVGMDPQGHLATACGAVPDESEPTVYEVITGRATAGEAIVTAPGGYDILPADVRLLHAEIELLNAPGRDMILKQALAPVADLYDFALVDAPPALNVLALMGLTAADGVIIVLAADYLALEGVAQLLETVDLVKQRLNPELQVTGALITFYKPNTKLSREVLDMTRAGLPGLVFKTQIGTYTALAEAPGLHCDIFDYKPASKAKQAREQYEAFAKELIKRTK